MKQKYGAITCIVIVIMEFPLAVKSFFITILAIALFYENI